MQDPVHQHKGFLTGLDVLEQLINVTECLTMVAINQAFSQTHFLQQRTQPQELIGHSLLHIDQVLVKVLVQIRRRFWKVLGH